MANILIVDDHAITLRLLSYTLQKNGYQVITAANGREALAILAGETVDLAIVDLAMPEMDGLTLLRQLRRDGSGRYESLRFVMLTASGEDHDRLSAESEGADDFLTKPCSSRELLGTVSRLLS